jgi:hypothetical protein
LGARDGRSGELFQDSFFQAQAARGAVVAAIVTGAVTFLSTRIPLVRTWFVAQRLPLIAAFLMSVVVAGAIGLFLRQLTWLELQPLKRELASENAGLTIFQGGRVDPFAPTAGDSCQHEIKSGKFEVAKVGEGDYRICFGDQLPDDSIILTGPMLKSIDAAANAMSISVVKSRNSFEARTLFNGAPTDGVFGFLVLR